MKRTLIIRIDMDSPDTRRPEGLGRVVCDVGRAILAGRIPSRVRDDNATLVGRVEVLEEDR